MKKMSKIVSITIFIIMCIVLFNNISYGLDITEFSGSDISNDKAKELINMLVTLFSVIGSILSVIVLIVLGIKYMLGSVEEKAQYKKSFMPYIIGCILVFSASSLAGIIYNMAIEIKLK